jgi:hypothetical protein
MGNDLAEIIQGCISVRRDRGVMEPHAIVDLGEGQDFAFVPFEQEGGPVQLQPLLWALGAMCKQRKAARVYVAIELSGRICKTEAEADAIMKKYPTPKDMPLDDRDQFLTISEVNFAAPKTSRTARIQIHGLGRGVTFGAPATQVDHICQIFHAVLLGFQSGIMPRGIHLVEENASDYMDPPEFPDL